MSTFWPVVTVLLLTGVVLLATAGDERDRINFTDLETECRYDRGTSSDIGLSGDSITFEGYFPASSPELNIEYDYSSSETQVTLNIFTEQVSISPQNETCLASVIYDGRTQNLDEGLYHVRLMHEGEVVEEAGIRVK